MKIPRNDTESDCHRIYALLAGGRDLTKTEILKRAKMSHRRFIHALRASRNYGDRTWIVGTVNGNPPTYTIIWKVTK